MSKGVGRAGLSEDLFDEPADDEDNISVTSTQPEANDSDSEYVVEAVLAENRSDPKNIIYLIKWQGYQLGECTWEPEENLGHELRGMWEETKDKHARGEETPFDVEIYNAAQRKIVEEKGERHRRRNEKRRKLGLPLTPPFPTGYARRREDSFSDAQSEESYGSESQAKRGGNEVPAKPTASSAKGSSSKLENTDKRTETRRSSVAKAATAPGKEPAGKKSSASASRTDSRTDRPTSNYSGTGRKVSENVGVKGKAAVPSQGMATSPPGPGRAAVGHSTMTAKKTAPKPKPAVNIFTSGKIKKPRTNLSQAMKDPSKEPKLFQNLRRVRQAEKRGRDMEDLPIAFEEVIPVNASAKVGGRTASNDAQSLSPLAQSPTALTQPKPAIVMPLEDAHAPSSLKKKRKSVRWVEEDGSDAGFVEEPEPMDIDSPSTSPRALPPRQPNSLSGSGPGRPHLRLRSPPPPLQNRDENSSPRKLSLDQYRTKVLVQNIDKELVLGSTAAVKVTFNGIPRDPAQAWISNFAAQGPIEFRHSVFSKSIMHRAGDLVKNRLSEGTITSNSDGSILEAASEYLRAGLLGLYCACQDYSIIIFPTGCDEWKEALVGQEPANLSGVALRYIIFQSPMEYRNFLRPYNSKMPAPAPTLAGESAGPDTGLITARRLMATHMLNLNYDMLVPKYNKLPAAHGFFLAFPKSRETTMISIIHWLRHCNPNCYIYASSRGPGGWAAYREGVNNKHFRGAVLVHEKLMAKLFRFPNLSEALINGCEDFWFFSESLRAVQPYLSLTPGPLGPGGFHFERLFPARTVVFLTPSFLVSEPQRAYEFLDWFLTFRKSHYYRLMTAYNVKKFLMDVAVEKEKEYNDLWARTDKSHTQKELDTNLWGLSKTNTAYRYKAAILASELHNLRVTNIGLFGIEDSGAEDDTSPLNYAPPFFDPNDEQSLVNWFGYWSISRYDQFRKFHVVGSSPAMKLNQRRTGERRIPVPKYARNMTNDPDVLLGLNQRKREESKRQHAEPNTQSHSHAKNTPGPRFRSDIIITEDQIAHYLHALLKDFPLKNTWILYKFPISWLDANMADHFDDFRQRFKKLDDWFRFVWNFHHPRQKVRAGNVPFSTYVGLFYTIAEDWDPQNIPPNTATPRRHPWLLIYRPVNLTTQSDYARCEVIIWDPMAKARFPGSRAPAERDLLDMQRRAVRYLCEHTAEKNPGSYIDQVWLGGFEYPADCESPYPFDTTVKFLKHLLGDLKKFMPAFEERLPRAGYRKVMMEGMQSQKSEFDMAMAMDIDDKEQDDPVDDDDTRIIFHAPRAIFLPRGQRTKCTNKLFEEARLARAHAADGDSVKHITYAFVPTEEWYAEQKLEGRSYEHINVRSWEPIFNSFKIGASATIVEGKATGPGTATDESGGESPASY